MTSLNITAEPNTALVSYTRDFKAPAELLLRAHTEADLLSKWLGPSSESMTVEKLDATHGGTWRYYSVGENGETYAFRGVFHGEPSVEHGLVQTFEWEGSPGDVCIEKMTFEDLGDGVTRLHATSAYLTVAMRDMMIEHGMEHGVVEGYRKLDALLETL
jgi:uncharacterized protein YndB with AHSA1/START domain